MEVLFLGTVTSSIKSKFVLYQDSQWSTHQLLSQPLQTSNCQLFQHLPDLSKLQSFYTNPSVLACLSSRTQQLISSSPRLILIPMILQRALCPISLTIGRASIPNAGPESPLAGDLSHVEPGKENSRGIWATPIDANARLTEIIIAIKSNRLEPSTMTRVHKDTTSPAAMECIIESHVVYLKRRIVVGCS